MLQSYRSSKVVNDVSFRLYSSWVNNTIGRVQHLQLKGSMANALDMADLTHALQKMLPGDGQIEDILKVNWAVGKPQHALTQRLLNQYDGDAISYGTACKASRVYPSSKDNTRDVGFERPCSSHPR